MLTIRPPADIAAFRALEALQRAVWGTPHGYEPAETMLTAHKNGGLVLAAYAPGSERPLGFVFGFLGRTPDGRLKHVSHMLGVLSEARDGGVGYRLKLAQREAVLAQGLRLMTWTYDPLQSRNARLNLRKLGATTNTYLDDLYGSMPGINEGLTSDRFQVDWRLDDARVARRLAGEVAVLPTTTRRVEAQGPADRPRPPEPPALDDARLLVEIPSDVQALKAADPGLAAAWRGYTRELFRTAFARGYLVTDLARSGGRSFYLLERPDDT